MTWCDGDDSKPKCGDCAGCLREERDALRKEKSDLDIAYGRLEAERDRLRAAATCEAAAKDDAIEQRDRAYALVDLYRAGLEKVYYREGPGPDGKTSENETGRIARLTLEGHHELCDAWDPFIRTKPCNCRRASATGTTTEVREECGSTTGHSGQVRCVKGAGHIGMHSDGRQIKWRESTEERKHDFRWDPCNPGAGGLLVCKVCDLSYCVPPWTKESAMNDECPKATAG